MAYSFYYIETHPVHHTKTLYTVAQANAFHKELWTWKAENPLKMIEEWPGFVSNGGECPIGFMYKFVCDLTKDKLGVRRCTDCPYKWIDRQTHKAVGRWSPWHWCDYPGALMDRYHTALKNEDFEAAKQVALEISNMTLSTAYADLATQTIDRPTFDELVRYVDDIRRVRGQAVFLDEAWQNAHNGIENGN